MNYSKIFTDTFKLLWQRKKLWLISLLGLVLMLPITGFYTVGMMWKQRGFMQVIMATTPNLSVMPETSRQWFLMILPLVLLAGFFYLLSYVIDLLARGGGIREADLAWAGEAVQVRRGFRFGMRVALKVLGVDLLWLLPGLIVVLLLIAVAGFSLGNFFALLAQGDNVAGSDLARTFGGLFGSMLLLLGLSWIYSAIRGVIAPMMYQSVVLGQRTVGQGIAEGWALVRAHFGQLVVLWLLIMAVNMGLGMIMQVFIVPVNMLLMPNMMNPDIALSATGELSSMSLSSWLLFIAGGLFIGAASWLSRSLIQAFSNTLYARVYRELTDTQPQASEDEGAYASIISTS